MAITLFDNTNSTFTSYQKGWEMALKTYDEEENNSKPSKGRNGLKKRT